MTGCVCKEPGYCERHGCKKYPAWWKLCQTRDDYFALWEAGQGPGQKPNNTQVKRKHTPRMNGVGSHLKRMLGCCKWPHSVQMNAWGPDGCRENRDTIVAWMVEEGAKKKTRMNVEAATRLLDIAISQTADPKTPKATNNMTPIKAATRLSTINEHQSPSPP